jgi:hypothetical protein
MAICRQSRDAVAVFMRRSGGRADAMSADPRRLPQSGSTVISTLCCHALAGAPSWALIAPNRPRMLRRPGFPRATSREAGAGDAVTLGEDLPCQG